MPSSQPKLIHGNVGSAFSSLIEAWSSCTFGYEEPNEVHCSMATKKVLFSHENSVKFRDATIITDEQIPDGLVELRNTNKRNNPLFHALVIFDDFGDSRGE